MKRFFAIGVLVLWAAVVAAAPSQAGGKAPAEGDRLPEFTLAAPPEAEGRAYLGLSGQASFKPADVQAEVLIIEVFNMY